MDVVDVVVDVVVVESNVEVVEVDVVDEVEVVDEVVVVVRKEQVAMPPNTTVTTAKISITARNNWKRVDIRPLSSTSSPDTPPSRLMPTE